MEFDTTRWSIVLAARERSDPGSEAALAQLCEGYWFPLYAFVRRNGHDREEAKDLTQAYFVKLLEKNYLDDVDPGAGRFRSFLLASVKHFLANERDASQAIKRGGGKVPLSLDVDDAEDGLIVEPVEDETPESLFERQWARVLLQRTSEALRAELATSNKEAQFDLLRPFLVFGKAGGSYRDAARELDMTEAAVKMSVHRLRRRFGELLRDEVSHTVADAGQVDAEIRYLFDALRR